MTSFSTATIPNVSTTSITDASAHAAGPPIPRDSSQQSSLNVMPFSLNFLSHLDDPVRIRYNQLLSYAVSGENAVFTVCLVVVTQISVFDTAVFRVVHEGLHSSACAGTYFGTSLAIYSSQQA
jgi:hypothetical protein